MTPTTAPGPRRVRRLLLLALLGGLVALPTGADTATAGCAAPYLTAPEASSDGTPPLVPGDQPLPVRGAAFVVGCDDTGGGNGLGCGTDAEVETPMEDVRLLLRQAGRTWELGTADAGSADDQELGQVAWQVELPDDVRPGRAVLVADPGDEGEPVRLPIRVG